LFGSNFRALSLAYTCPSICLSQARGAGWFADYIEDQEKAGAQPKDGIKIENVILKGGLKGWVNAGEEYREWMTAFEPDFWKQFADLKV
jgi:hypothetical protein